MREGKCFLSTQRVTYGLGQGEEGKKKETGYIAGTFDPFGHAHQKVDRKKAMFG
jgi:hypothetical protein